MGDIALLIKSNILPLKIVSIKESESELKTSAVEAAKETQRYCLVWKSGVLLSIHRAGSGLKRPRTSIFTSIAAPQVKTSISNRFILGLSCIQKSHLDLHI